MSTADHSEKLTPDEQARAEMDAEAKGIYKTNAANLGINRITHSLRINKYMLVALLKRCGHEIDENAIFVWDKEGVIAQWETSVL